MAWPFPPSSGGSGKNPEADPATGFAEIKLPEVSPRWVAEVIRQDGTVLRLAHDVSAHLLVQLLGPG